MSTATNKSNVIAVFTGKSLSHILKDGGSQSWVLNRNKAKHCEYLVCCRSGIDWVEGPEPRGSAFLVGRISGVAASTETPERWRIEISEFARVDLPDTWKGWRNPVRYTDFDSLGIDPRKLVFEPMPERDPTAIAQPDERPLSADTASLTIAEAKRGLARGFGVREDAVEITIRG